MSAAVADDHLAERVADMVAWLELMMRPVENWDDVDPDRYRHTDDDALELGERVADDLLTEWAWRSPDSLVCVLKQRIAYAARRAPRRPPTPEPDPEPEVFHPGDWVIDIGLGTMLCGYCGHTASWAHAALGYATLTGIHMLGVHRETGDLVVLAEATTLGSGPVPLPHHCRNIPAEVHEKYADEIQAAKRLRPTRAGRRTREQERNGARSEDSNRR